MQRFNAYRDDVPVPDRKLFDICGVLLWVVSFGMIVVVLTIIL